MCIPSGFKEIDTCGQAVGRITYNRSFVCTVKGAAQSCYWFCLIVFILGTKHLRRALTTPSLLLYVYVNSVAYRFFMHRHQTKVIKQEPRPLIPQYSYLHVRVARWYISKPKIPIWVCVGGP
jgi:hypothetical protein